MVPFVLPVMLLVAERASKEEFVEHILPHLKPIMKMTEPVQVSTLNNHMSSWNREVLKYLHLTITLFWHSS